MSLWDHRWYIRHQTSYPILKVDRFWGGRDSVIDEYLDFCDCPDDLPDDCICDQHCISWCINLCNPLEIKEVLPHTKIQQWLYKVAWWTTPGMWWEWWQILHILPKQIPPRMFVTYYRWFNPITSYNQVVPNT